MHSNTSAITIFHLQMTKQAYIYTCMCRDQTFMSIYRVVLEWTQSCCLSKVELLIGQTKITTLWCLNQNEAYFFPYNEVDILQINIHVCSWGIFSQILPSSQLCISFYMTFFCFFFL